MQPFFSGKDCTVTFNILSNLRLAVKSWECKAVVVDADDGICGEKRDRLQTIIKYFDLTLTCNQEETSVLDNLMRNIANDDSPGAAPLNKGLLLTIRTIGSGDSNYRASGDIVVGAFSFGTSGRTERNTITIPIRCQEFDKV